MSEHTFMRYQQYQAVTDPVFRGMVEASLMIVADDMLDRPAEDPVDEQRAGLARLMFNAETPQSQVDSYVTRFCWHAVTDAAVIAEFVAAAGDYTEISDQALDAAVRGFWDTAANVQPGPGAPPAEEGG